MQRIVTFAIMSIALLAFCAPGLAREADAVSVSSQSVLTTVVETIAVLTVSKCKQMGDKSLLTCPTALAVLAPAVPLPGRTEATSFGLSGTLAISAHGPDAELPPPRLG